MLEFNDEARFQSTTREWFNNWLLVLGLVFATLFIIIVTTVLAAKFCCNRTRNKIHPIDDDQDTELGVGGNQVN
ncbi:unnamed protein product [Arabis nemorensis]|uniref:Uncharacterized protein n=1 Tax=Arabis nemorensis TaxID=586526 RepID=A0A565CI82_9BRAS|nr:unnamed protein product [Arabis nemorensis]